MGTLGSSILILVACALRAGAGLMTWGVFGSVGAGLGGSVGVGLGGSVGVGDGVSVGVGDGVSVGDGLGTMGDRGRSSATMA